MKGAAASATLALPVPGWEFSRSGQPPCGLSGRISSMSSAIIPHHMSAGLPVSGAVVRLVVLPGDADLFLLRSGLP